jgi:putative glutamine amidotransferase
MPTIGITSCRKIEDYRQSVLHVRGEARILDPSMTVDDALAGVDGLLLTGGEDVGPALYHEEPHAQLGEVDDARDAFEIALIARARTRGLPILAICRGVQILNVACGGSLVQDIPSEVAGAIEHRLAVPPHQSYDLAHEIWMEPDSLLARLMKERVPDSDVLQVNSRHHQAVKAIAENFKVSATAPDGIVEAIEDPSVRFCLASSGTRKTSGAPASSARSSKASSTPPPPLTISSARTARPSRRAVCSETSRTPPSR